MTTRIGTGSNSFGQLWYGDRIHFPGFLYKKNNAIGAKRSTRFNPGGGLCTNTYQNVNNH